MYRAEFDDQKWECPPGHVAMTIQGPRSVQGYFAGHFTPDELDALAIAAIRAADAKRQEMNALRKERYLSNNIS